MIESTIGFFVMMYFIMKFIFFVIPYIFLAMFVIGGILMAVIDG